jgi:hypothetical protein
MELYIITFFEQGHIVDQYVKVFRDIKQATQFATNEKMDYESFRVDRVKELEGYQIIVKEVTDEKDISAH